MLSFKRLLFNLVRDVLRVLKRPFYIKGAKKLYNERFSLKDDDYHSIVRDIPLEYFRAFSKERDINNDYYGIATVLKSYMGIRNNYSLKCFIEHGIYFGKTYGLFEDMSPYDKTIFMGPARAEYLEGLKGGHYPIGPYIYYAQPTMDPDKIKKAKEENGKTLVVFPTHSTVAIDVRYNVDRFIEEIARIKNDHLYKKVIVCLYWKDYTQDIVRKYEACGFSCVTAGHQFDFKFLNRLRTIIELSDVTMSNNIGTHIGYSLILNKPHYLFYQDKSLHGKPRFIKKDDVEVYGKNDLIESFGSYGETVTDRQKKAGNLYFGVNQVKAKRDLARLLKVAND